MESVNVDAFMQQVRDRGFEIQDYGVVSGVRRFMIVQGERGIYLDIDQLLWPDMTQEGLLRQVELATQTWSL